MLVERCENCGTKILRDPAQPRRCANCAPPSSTNVAVHRALAALHAQRGTVSDQPAVRLAAVPR